MRRSCDISSSNMAAYERWPRVSARGTKYSSEVCRMGAQAAGQREFHFYLMYMYYKMLKNCMHTTLIVELLTH